MAEEGEKGKEKEDEEVVAKGGLRSRPLPGKYASQRQ